jgi:hypothetical protein
MSWVLDWGVVRAMGDLDGLTSTRQKAPVVGEWWGYSEAKAFRRQAAFRRSFPDLASPEDLIDLRANGELREFFLRMAAVAVGVDRRRAVAKSMADGLGLVTSAVSS